MNRSTIDRRTLMWNSLVTIKYIHLSQNLFIKEIFDEAKSDKSKAEIGINTGKPIKIITLCTWNKNIYLFDLLTNPCLMIEGRLKELIESEQVLKVYIKPYFYLFPVNICI